MTREHGLWALGGLGSLVVVLAYLLVRPRYEKWLHEQMDREAVERWNQDNPVG